MRKTITAAALFAGLVIIVAPAGCFFDLADDCNFNMNLECYYNNQGGSGGTGGSAPECIPSATNKQIDDGCGAFVSPTGSDANGDGTKDNPYLTLKKAAEEKSRVYACANPDKPFDLAVEPAADVVFYGGFDCASADWPYDPTKKSAWTAPSDSVPLTVSGDIKVEVYDFAITARDAAMPGGSSVAVLASGDKTELLLERCDVLAGAGKDGEPGTTPDTIGPNHEGEAGSQGGNGDGGDMNGEGLCVAAGYLGGAGGQHVCGLQMEDVAGGLGGNGTNGATGAPGGDGLSQPGPMPTDGKGGVWDAANGVCTAGKPGAVGTAGLPGAGASGFGILSASGYSGVAGDAGKSHGSNGQGGGGGGGAKACVNSKAGPGGGGGGAGGCGGRPGTGGKPGGASIGIAAVNAKAVSLTTVRVTTGTGGHGGKGGNGQPGGSGGKAGLAGGTGACDGAPGGAGGRGGSAGGGLGGHSVAIAFTGTPPAQNDVTLTSGTAGKGGDGGDANDSLKGADGLACKTLQFDDGKCQ